MASFASTIESAVDKYFSKNQKYFKSRKGENFELKNDLNSEYKSIRKDAVKRVIANMTLGKNVSELFADVLKCMQTDDIELKKLVYLYLMNYAKSQPELVILAVNTFIKDAEDLNPLIRALAIRTMGCLRAEKIVDYLFEPLRKCLKDPDPYVRKTAAICVAKMFTLAPDRTVEYGFVETVEQLLQDDNPMVIANSIASLHEMRSYNSSTIVNLNINSQSLSKLLNALNEATEWGQIVIMESLCDYHKIVDPEEAMLIAEKTSARLQHQNPSVVITAVRLIFICLLITNPEFTEQMLKKLKGPIISLLNVPTPELLFSFLRNIHIIVEKYPTLLNNDLRPFFVKYNDPPYVKLEKLALLRKLANIEQIDVVLSELKEYASEVDIEFCSEAIHSFECIALKFPNTAEKCVNALLALLKTKIDYICSDTIKALRNIIRKYPGQFDSSVEFIAPYLQQVDGLPGKDAIIWLIGEFPGHVNGIYDVLEGLSESFPQETYVAMLQIVVMIVKCFLKRPNDQKIQSYLQTILTAATESSYPDIRDRAYVYWRLLSTQPEITRQVVWLKKSEINEKLEQWEIPQTLLNTLLKELSTLSALFHEEKQLFLKDKNTTTETVAIEEEVQEELLLLDLNENVAFGSPVLQALPVMDVPALVAPVNLLPLLSTEHVKITYKYQDLQLFLCFENITNQPLSDFQLQFNKNNFGLVPAALLNVPVVKAKEKVTTNVPLTIHLESMFQPTQPFDEIQIAIKHDKGVCFGQSVVPLMIVTSVPQIKLEMVINDVLQTEMKQVTFTGCKNKQGLQKFNNKEYLVLQTVADTFIMAEVQGDKVMMRAMEVGYFEMMRKYLQ